MQAMATQTTVIMSSMVGIQVSPTLRLSGLAWDHGKEVHIPRSIHELLATGGIHTQGQFWGPVQFLSMLEVGEGTERCHPLV